MGAPADDRVRQRRREAGALLALVALAVAAGVGAVRFGLWDGFQPGPGLFPLLACVFTAAMAVVALLGLGTDADAADLAGEPAIAEIAHAEEEAGRGATDGDRRRFAWYFATSAGWPVAFVLAGFVLSSAAALLALLRGGERLSWPTAVATAAAIVGSAWLVFEYVLGVPLPRGPLAGI